MKTKHSLEENLERIADALEILAGSPAPAPAAEEKEPPKPRTRRGGKGSKAAKPEPAPEPETPAAEEPETPAVTHDDVRESMRLFRKKHAKEDAVKILAKLGSASITALPKDKLAEAKRRFDEADLD